MSLFLGAIFTEIGHRGVFTSLSFQNKITYQNLASYLAWKCQSNFNWNWAEFSLIPNFSTPRPTHNQSNFILAWNFEMNLTGLLTLIWRKMRISSTQVISASLTWPELGRAQPQFYLICHTSPDKICLTGRFQYIFDLPNWNFHVFTFLPQNYCSAQCTVHILRIFTYLRQQGKFYSEVTHKEFLRVKCNCRL